MSKNLLLIVNPVAGTKKANKYLTDILSLFSLDGFVCQVQTTSKEVNAEQLVVKYGAKKKLIVCIGGDGTFNEVVSGCLKADISPLLGYIPSGSTNDFAKGLKLSANPLKATNNIIKGSPQSLDVGLFNGRAFVYTASFGMFTRTAYNTSRDLKNLLGYFAYVLEGVKELGDIKSFKLKIKSAENSAEGEYIYGGVCNSRRVGGGLIQFSEQSVDMNDGMLEVFLIRKPRNAAEFMQLVFELNAGNYNCPLFEFFSTDALSITTEDDIDWTIDGEYHKGDKVISIKNVHSAISLLM